MKKTLYSLMLSDDVVRAVDALAHRMGTNRSALVNQILAEYTDMVTPERQVQDIFRQIGEILGTDQDLVPFVAPNAMSMSMKSSLQYRYRPTVKYSVELYRDREGTLGELSVVFRTQSQELLDAMGRFFRLWKEVEDELISAYHPVPVEYALRAAVRPADERRAGREPVRPGRGGGVYPLAPGGQHDPINHHGMRRGKRRSRPTGPLPLKFAMLTNRVRGPAGPCRPLGEQNAALCTARKVFQKEVTLYEQR